MEDKLVTGVQGLISEYGLPDVLLMLLVSLTDGNTSNAVISNGDAGVLIVRCGAEEVRVSPGKDSLLRYKETALQPKEAADVIRAFMVATCLASREQRNG